MKGNCNKQQNKGRELSFDVQNKTQLQCKLQNSLWKQYFCKILRESERQPQPHFFRRFSTLHPIPPSSLLVALLSSFMDQSCSTQSHYCWISYELHCRYLSFSFSKLCQDYIKIAVGTPLMRCVFQIHTCIMIRGPYLWMQLAWDLILTIALRVMSYSMTQSSPEGGLRQRVWLRASPYFLEGRQSFYVHKSSETSIVCECIVELEDPISSNINSHMYALRTYGVTHYLRNEGRHWLLKELSKLKIIDYYGR